MKRFILIVTVLLLPLVLSACGMRMQAASTGSDPEESYVSPNPEKSKDPEIQVVYLYFADHQAQYVMPEAREIAAGDRLLAEVVVEELLKGPEDPYLQRGIPEGVAVKSVTMDSASDTVIIDFDQNVREKFPQGSAGAQMFFGSLILSLTDLAGVEQVVIEVDGDNEEPLDQFDISQPGSRGSIATYPVFIDQDRARWLQQEAEQGRQTWRFDPLKVAEFDGRMFGFGQNSKFSMISATGQGEYSGTGEAEVEVIHDNKRYVIQLIQPVKTGKDGIWMINNNRAE